MAEHEPARAHSARTQRDHEGRAAPQMRTHDGGHARGIEFDDEDVGAREHRVLARLPFGIRGECGQIFGGQAHGRGARHGAVGLHEPERAEVGAGHFERHVERGAHRGRRVVERRHAAHDMAQRADLVGPGGGPSHWRVRGPDGLCTSGQRIRGWKHACWKAGPDGLSGSRARGRCGHEGTAVRMPEAPHRRNGKLGW